MKSPLFARALSQSRNVPRPLLVQETAEGPCICPGASLLTSSLSVARRFDAAGVKSGQRLAFRCGTAMDWIAVALAGLKTGLVLCPSADEDVGAWAATARASWSLSPTGELVPIPGGTSGTPGWLLDGVEVAEADLERRVWRREPIASVEAKSDWHQAQTAIDEGLYSFFNALEVHCPQWSDAPPFVPLLSEKP